MTAAIIVVFSYCNCTHLCHRSCVYIALLKLYGNKHEAYNRFSADYRDEHIANGIMFTFDGYTVTNMELIADLALHIEMNIYCQWYNVYFGLLYSNKHGTYSRFNVAYRDEHIGNGIMLTFDD